MAPVRLVALLSSLALLGAAAALLTRERHRELRLRLLKGQSPWSLGQTSCSRRGRGGRRRHTDRRPVRVCGGSLSRPGVGIRNRGDSFGSHCDCDRIGRGAPLHRRCCRGTGAPVRRRSGETAILGQALPMGTDPTGRGRRLVRPPRSHRRHPTGRRQGRSCRLLGTVLPSPGAHCPPRDSHPADHRAASSLASGGASTDPFDADRTPAIAG